MSTTSKSPLRVAREALAVACRTLRPYAHKFSPKTYTQPQLFVCLVLKTFFKTDYRGIAQFLADLRELRQAVGLRRAPHFTTLQKAGRRLLRLPRVRRLLGATVRRFSPRRRRVRRAAFDSTGMDLGQRSLYFVRRRSRSQGQPWQTVAYRRYAKLEASFDCASHLILGLLTSRGPAVDTDRFVPLLEETLRTVGVRSALADAGYDSEANHRHARERRGVLSFMPAAIGRPSSKPPAGRYRRRMRQRLDKDYGRYGQRWQAETGFSMIKRRLASALGARSYGAERREMRLLALTHNLMILADQ